MSIKTVVAEFTQSLQTLIHDHSMERARAAVLQVFGGEAPRKPGRPPKGVATVASRAVKPRKKLPPQFCPVPGCKNVAAPVFGMVCATHKGVAKSKIKKYREARKAKKNA